MFHEALPRACDCIYLSLSKMDFAISATALSIRHLVPYYHIVVFLSFFHTFLLLFIVGYNTPECIWIDSHRRQTWVSTTTTLGIKSCPVSRFWTRCARWEHSQFMCLPVWLVIYFLDSFNLSMFKVQIILDEERKKYYLSNVF